MTQLFEASIVEKIACLRREINKRMEVYPRLIASGKMTLEKAEREMDIMRAILHDYEVGGKG